MNSWRVKFLGDGMWAPIVCAEIEEAFQPVFETAGSPAEMAVFVRRMEGDVHCEVAAYFSPAAAMLADAFEAQSCLPPPREGLELLAGAEACWAALFPSPGL